MRSCINSVFVQASEAHTASIIFVHGLGQSNATWRLVVQEALAPSLPFVKWILPQARSDLPVTYYQGSRRPSWFDISELPPNHSNVHENCDQIKESISIIENLILEEVHNGIEPRRIVLVGFSQGAALGLMVSFSTLYELGGVVSLSGWVPHRARPVSTSPELA
jgi:lysophospholipase-2